MTTTAATTHSTTAPGGRVRVDVADDGVATVTLNRADKLNAMDWPLFSDLHAAAATVRDEAVAGRARAVLLIGDGRAFSAGLDVSLFGEQAAGDVPGDDRIAWLQDAFTGFEDLPVPVIAAVRGVALGAGCQLALACHQRLAAPDASFGVLEVRWGIVPDLGGTWRLPRLVGLGRATDLCLSGRTIDAQTALAWGLVDAVLPQDRFETAARERVAALAAGPTRALGAIPRLLREGQTAPREDGLAAERRVQAECLESEDFREAALAALERRPPRFSGR